MLKLFAWIFKVPKMLAHFGSSFNDQVASEQFLY